MPVKVHEETLIISGRSYSFHGRTYSSSNIRITTPSEGAWKTYCTGMHSL